MTLASTLPSARPVTPLGILAAKLESLDRQLAASDVNFLLDNDLLIPHGSICVDNTLMQGQPYSAGESTANGIAIATFNQTIADDPRIDRVLLPLRDGLTLIRRL